MNIHGCKLFPKPQEVFSEKVDLHRSVLLPFMVMPLSLIVPGSPVKVPWVIPHEPYEGCVGQGAKKFYSFFSRENWIGFELIGGKLRFDSDFRFFLKHRKPDVEADDWVTEAHKEVERRYGRCKDDYRRSKVALMSSHHVQVGRIDGRQKFPGEGVFDQLGGQPTSGNWASTQKKPYFEKTSSYPKPIDQNGRPLIFLGAISPTINHANQVLGFINEDLNHVAFTFDFS